MEDGYRMGEEGQRQFIPEYPSGGASPLGGCGLDAAESSVYHLGGSDTDILRIRRRSISDDTGLIQHAINRYLEFREHIPFIRWGALLDSANSTYESYVNGNPNIRDGHTMRNNQCAWMCNGPYFAPDPFNWENEFHVGGKSSEAASSNKPPAPEVTPEIMGLVRRALHLWFLLDHPKYDEGEDIALFQEKDVVHYAQQGRDFVRALNATGNFHKASRAERYAYRSRLKEGTVPRDERGRCVCRKGEFQMLIKTLRGSIWEDEPIVPFRAP